MKNIAKQQGISVMGALFGLVLVGFFASIGFKVLPHYMDNKALVKMINAVDRDSGGVQIRSVGEFYTHLNKNMSVNNIRDLNAADIVEIRSEGPDFYVDMKYEVREPILKNIDLVVKFEQKFRVRNQ
ncbi:MAG: DUF4845 domain-containing protein [Thiopseudomonas sp.]|nr:DUF4845 domain-containing protein [Thiopseudomonas sp.]